MTATEPATADSPPRAVVAALVTHNRHDVLQETLDAVLAQTRPPDSVLVVDNGSVRWHCGATCAKTNESAVCR